MTDCDRALELISAGLDGALTPEEKDWLEKHLEHCPACRKHPGAPGTFLSWFKASSPAASRMLPFMGWLFGGIITYFVFLHKFFHDFIPFQVGMYAIFGIFFRKTSCFVLHSRMVVYI